MYKLIISKLAQKELEDIVEYIAVQLANPAAALTFLDEIEKCYEYLKSNPAMYAKSIDRRLEKEGYRKALIKKYLLLFKVNEETKTVTIYHFVHGSMDYIRLL
jgi:Plasmid stabilization system protein